MKKSIVLLTLSVFVLAGNVRAQSGDEDMPSQTYRSAVGVRFSPNDAIINNSITFKHFLTDQSALEVLFTFGDPAFGALYEIHKPLTSSGLQWFYGAGGYVGFIKEFNPARNKNETNTNIGGMGVVGLDYKFTNIPLNLSLDWKPELNLISDIHVEVAAIGLSARFTF